MRIAAINNIHFFRAGKHTSSDGRTVNFTEKMLSDIASNYAPERHEAPLVVGHPKSDEKALGWVGAVYARPGGLYASPKQVNTEFAEMVRKGEFKKVSASFYSPESPNNPTPNEFYLRHIGFLGAQAPAVKGLDPVHFADNDITIEFGEESIEDLRNFSENRYRLGEVVSEIKRLNKEGRVAIGMVDTLVQFAESLKDDVFIEFAEAADGRPLTPQSEMFLEILRRLPIPVQTGELVNNFEDDDRDAEFKMPDGHQADPESMVLLNRAKAYQREKGGTFEQAIRAVTAR